MLKASRYSNSEKDYAKIFYPVFYDTLSFGFIFGSLLSTAVIIILFSNGLLFLLPS